MSTNEIFSEKACDELEGMGWSIDFNLEGDGSIVLKSSPKNDLTQKELNRQGLTVEQVHDYDRKVKLKNLYMNFEVILNEIGLEKSNSFDDVVAALYKNE